MVSTPDVSGQSEAIAAVLPAPRSTPQDASNAASEQQPAVSPPAPAAIVGTLAGVAGLDQATTAKTSAVSDLWMVSLGIWFALLSIVFLFVVIRSRRSDDDPDVEVVDLGGR